MKTALTVLTSLMLLAGCASDQAYREGERLLAEGRAQEGLQQLEQAMREQPGNAQVRAAYLRARETQLRKSMREAEEALAAGRLDEATAGYQAVLKLHPENARALSGLLGVETARRNRDLLRQAQEALDKGEPEMARQKLRIVLAQTPGQAQAVALLKQLDAKAGKPEGIVAPALDPKFRRAITLEFRDAPLRSVFDAISRQSGLNFVLDKDVRTDSRATIYAKDTAILDAVDMLLATSQLDRKVVSPNTLLVYPNLPHKQREYQDLVVKSFFLANADPKVTLNMVKTMTRTKDVFIDDKLNLLVVRDTPEAVRLIEKLIAVQDRPEPEVMLEVEILEVKRSKLLDLGAQWPNQFSVLARETQQTTTPVGNSTQVIDTKVNAPLTIQLLKGIDGSDILVSPTPTINLRAEDGDVNILANPRIRVKNREKAKIHVGDKVPVITSNVTSTGVTSESVSYLDVGLKLDVEPLVYLEGDVGIKVGLEVSNIVQQVKSSTGTLTYQLGSRNASTSLRLKDGETQVLAGLISDEDRSSASKVPGLGDIPLLGRLFSSHSDNKSKTEIVLLITPRVVRNVARPELADGEFYAGTEAAVSDQTMRIRQAAPGASAGGGVGARGGLRRPPIMPPLPQPEPADETPPEPPAEATQDAQPPAVPGGQQP
ncbi:MAG: secretin N-terminal domain-containing protein [Pseudomonadota bacterium]